MSTQTAKLQLVKPALTEYVDLSIINANMDKIDGKIGAISCTSSSRPTSPFNGMLGIETDTGDLIVYVNGWHIVGSYGAWQAASFGANWSNNTIGRGTVRYRKTGNNTVMLTGVAKRLSTNATNGNIIMNLPEGYRPPIGHMAPTVVVENKNGGAVTIGEDGTVTLEMDVLANQHVMLTGIEVPLT